MTARKGLLIQIILFLVCIPIAWNIVTHASSVQDSVNKINANGTIKEIVGDEFNREDTSARLHNPDMNFLLKVLVIIFAIGTKLILLMYSKLTFIQLIGFAFGVAIALFISAIFELDKLSYYIKWITLLILDFLRIFGIFGLPLMLGTIMTVFFILFLLGVTGFWIIFPIVNIIMAILGKGISVP